MSMWEDYTNCKEINELQNTLYGISPNLKLAGFTLSNGDEKRATHAMLVVEEKGNKRIIEKLLSMGFSKRRRQRTSRHCWDMADNYSFLVTLEKHL